VIEAECPSGLTLRLARSAALADRLSLAADATFFVGGILPITERLIDLAPGLRLIQKWGVGVDKIDLAAARARGIPVAITAGANAGPVAEFTLLLMLATLRQLPHRTAQLRAGQWQTVRDEARVRARQLRGRVVGLIGLGAVGREVARRLRAFDTDVRYYDVRRLSPADEGLLQVRFREIDTLIAEADLLSLHVPLTPSTRGLLSRERIDRLKPDAIVINTARGELVDEPALAEALASGRLAGAGLDVFGAEPPPPDHPLLRLTVPGLVLAPHMAGSVFDNVANVARHVFTNVRRILDGTPIPAQDLVQPPGPHHA
jgi:phosphoglycerate dehydrogenase-like enzyme